MGALPKRKISKGRRDRRRSHDFLVEATLTKCNECNEKKRAHHVCPNCGTYKGIQVIKVD